jgi:hypothetical protein
LLEGIEHFETKKEIVELLVMYVLGAYMEVTLPAYGWSMGTKMRDLSGLEAGSAKQ